MESIKPNKTSAVVEEQEQKMALTAEEELMVNEMIEAGVLYGRKHSVINPKMSNYILGTRKGIDILDLLKTKKKLEEAVNFFKKIREEKRLVLVVSEKPSMDDLIKDFANKYDWPFVTVRWLGGTLTNFKIISQRINIMKQMRDEKARGEWEKYTKKERLMKDREFNKLEVFFGGLEKLTELPAAVFIVDVADHSTAVNEANRLGIPIVGLINTDGDPDKIKYPIPGNDNARSSVVWILNKIKELLG